MGTHRHEQIKHNAGIQLELYATELLCGVIYDLSLLRKKKNNSDVAVSR